MANIKTFNLSVYLPGSNSKTITFRGISRVTVERYKKFYLAEYSNPYFNVETR